MQATRTEGTAIERATDLGHELRRAARGLGRIALALCVVLGALPVAEAQDEGARKLRYVQAGPNGARARNLYDAQGLVVLDVAPQTVLAVYGERSGWLDVEAPGGFKVWVYGKYVRPASTAGMVEITGSNVRMRPLPSSGPESLPLARKFTLGETVRLIRRNDSSLALAEDWVQVWSPPGARAWVRASETTPVDSRVEGSRLWADAVASAVSTKPVVEAPKTPPAVAKGKPAPAAAAAKQEPARATDLLRKADQLLAAERERDDQGGQPNYAVVVGAYEDVLELTDNGPTADLARGRIQLAKSYADAYQIRLDLENQKVEYQKELQEREAKKETARGRDVFEGRFAERGWLERRKGAGPDAEPVWVLHYAGGDVAELACSSGRYDMNLFRDFEIGVNGAVVRGTTSQDLGAPALPRVIDVTSIEVISGRKAH